MPETKVKGLFDDVPYVKGGLFDDVPYLHSGELISAPVPPTRDFETLPPAIDRPSEPTRLFGEPGADPYRPTELTEIPPSTATSLDPILDPAFTPPSPPAPQLQGAPEELQDRLDQRAAGPSPETLALMERGMAIDDHYRALLRSVPGDNFEARNAVRQEWLGALEQAGIHPISDDNIEQGIIPFTAFVPDKETLAKIPGVSERMAGNIHAVTDGVAELAEGLTSPLALAGAGAFLKSGKTARALMSGGFSIFAGHQLTGPLMDELGVEFAKPAGERDEERIVNLITIAAGLGVISTGAGFHSVRGGARELVTQPVQRTYSPEQLKAAAKRFVRGESPAAEQELIGAFIKEALRVPEGASIARARPGEAVVATHALPKRGADWWFKQLGLRRWEVMNLRNHPSVVAPAPEVPTPLRQVKRAPEDRPLTPETLRRQAPQPAAPGHAARTGTTVRAQPPGPWTAPTPAPPSPVAPTTPAAAPSAAPSGMAEAGQEAPVSRQPEAASPPKPEAPAEVGITPPGFEYLKALKDYFTPPTPTATPEIVIRHGARLPRLQPYDTQKLLATTPHGMARIPVLGQIMDTRAKAHHEADVPIITRQFSVEMGKTFGAVWARAQWRANKLFVADDSGTIEMAGGKRGYMEDVIKAELQKPGSQPLTDQQRAWINDEWLPIRAEVEAMLREEGVKKVITEEFEYAVGEDYFPRPVVGKKGLPALSILGTAGRPGAKPFFQKKRLYPTEEEGARPPRPGEKKEEILYDPNAVSRVAKFISGAFRAVADHRLANDPALGAQTVDQRLAELVKESEGLELLSKEDRADAMAQLREQAAHPILGREEYLEIAPAFRNKIFPSDVAKKLRSVYGQEQSDWLKAAANVTAASKAMTAVGDLSQFMIQGAAILPRHPVRWTRAVRYSLESLYNPDVLGRVMENPEYKTAVEEFTQVGGNLLRLMDFLAGARRGAFATRVPIVGPVLERLGHAYGVFIDMAKIELWRAWSPLFPKEQWGRLAETVENLVFMGRMESIGLSPGRMVAERVFPFAMAYYRGAGGILATATARGKTGNMTRQFLGSYIAAGLLTAVAGWLLSGMDWDEIQERLDPRRGKFLMTPLDLGDGSRVEVGYGNILTQLFRLLFQAADYHLNDQPIDTGVENNPYLRFLRARAAFVPSVATDTLTGRDFMGNRITMKESVARHFIPFSLQSAFPRDESVSPRQRPFSAAFTFMGIRSFPESEAGAERRLMESMAKEMYERDYADLRPAERARVIKAFTDREDFKKREPRPQDIERWIRINEQRRMSLRAALSKADREQLDRMGLDVASYKTTMRIAGQDVPLTEDEQERYEALLAEEYAKTLARVSEDRFARMRPADREAAWSRLRTGLSARARGRLLQELNRKERTAQ